MGVVEVGTGRITKAAGNLVGLKLVPDGDNSFVVWLLKPPDDA